MHKAGQVLGGALRRLHRPEAALAWLESTWPKIVGKALAARTRPLRCTGGCLEIAADNKAWRKQLEDMKREFCARINEAWGGHLIREVKFVAKPGPKHISHELNNEHTPFIRRGKR
jgi:predicted nucleic acid-binding Zn ribbon protein